MIVSEKECPPLLTIMGLAYWERSSDPSHVDAFPKELRNAEGLTKGTRAEGWMAIDWSENPIGFIADGEEYPDDDTVWIRYLGPFNHDVCVSSKVSYIGDLFARHALMIRQNTSCMKTGIKSYLYKAFGRNK